MERHEFKIAAEIIRKMTIFSMAEAGYGHIGGCMSLCEVLAVLYGSILNVDPKYPQKENRDRLILSKGHCGPVLYAALAWKGYFSRELLKTLNQNNTNLPSHCDRLKTPGIDLSTGSLGQGVSLGIGVALGCKMKGINNHVYIIVGDGELQEGQVWEGVQFASHRKMDNVILIVDCNKRQLDGWVIDICNPYDIGKKLEAFGFEVFLANGQNCQDIYEALIKAKLAKNAAAVLLDTQKGQGCSFAEEAEFNHYMVIDRKMAEKAIADIDKRIREELLI